MASEISPLLAVAGPPGLLGLVVLMILLGYLVPLRMVRARLADKDAMIADKNAVIADLRRANDVLERNNTLLLRGNRAAAQVLEALPDVVGGETDATVV